MNVKVKQLLYALLGFVVFIHVAQAQTTVTGIVVDQSTGNPLEGATVRESGKSASVTTNVDGNFSIQVSSATASLQVSFIGYQSQVLGLNGRETLRITLQSAPSELEEVAVIGYGTQLKTDITGSVASLSASDIDKAPALTMDLALQGRAAGVQITSTSAEPGGGASIRIRGSNSISGNNEPLIVLDGYPLAESGEADGDAQSGQAGNVLSFLNPDEIESIDILKDASATAIYGARGANGVIVITTKGGKEGKARINLTSEISLSKIPDFPQMMNGPDFARLKDEYRIANGNVPRYDGVTLPLPEDVPSTDWVSLILRTGVSQRYQLAVSGGTKASKYFISGNYIGNEGIMKYTKFSRGNFRANLDNKLTPKLSLRSSINYTRSLNNRSDEGTGQITTPGAIFSAYKSNPAAIQGELSEDESELPGFQNPLFLLRDQFNETSDENLFMNIHAVYDLLPGLKLNLRAGANNKNNKRELFWPTSTARGELFNGLAVSNTFQFNDYLVETFANYSKKINDHKFDLAGGFSWQSNVARRLNNQVSDFPTDNLGVNGLQLGLLPSAPVSMKIKRELQSFYLRANYNYRQKYFLTISGRVDGSSVFSEHKKYGVFPSAAAAWTISNEDFLKNSYVLSNLKLRTSFGQTGSQAIPPYGSLSRLGVANYVVGGGLVSGATPAILGNLDLEWEKTTQADIGIDMGLFNSKLDVTIDAYYKRTDDLLQDFQLPPSVGYASTRTNIGSIENRGLEITIGGKAIDKAFSWYPNFNISFNRSKVLELGGVGSEIYGPNLAQNIVAVPGNVMKEGQPYGSFYGYRVIGLIQSSDFNEAGNPTIPLLNSDSKLGHWKFEDVNGDGVVTPDDRLIIGDPNPKFIVGWNNDFTYKRFSLNVFFQGSYGGKMMNVDRLFIASGRLDNNQLNAWNERRWTVENQHNDIRWPGGMELSNLQPSTAIVEDGSFIRLKNVSLRYQFQFSAVPFLKNVELYVTAHNLFTITNYSGFDPEVGIFGQNNLAPGIDFASYPRARMYLMGLKLGL